jgi:hypothetical protein
MQSNGSAKTSLLQHRSSVDMLALPNRVLQQSSFERRAQAAALPGLWWFASEVQPDP